MAIAAKTFTKGRYKWLVITNPLDFQNFEELEVQVADIGGTWTPQRSLDGVNFQPWYVFDKDGNKLTTVTANGLYIFDGGAYFKFTGGSAGAWTVRGNK